MAEQHMIINDIDQAKYELTAKRLVEFEWLNETWFLYSVLSSHELSRFE